MGGHNFCDHFIPLARGELTDLLCTDKTVPQEERHQFRRLAEMVAAVFHLEYNRRLSELKTAYAPFDPDTDNVSLLPLSAEQRQARLNDLYCDFAWLLERANFQHLSRDEIEPAVAHASAWGIRMDVDFSAFEHIAIFARGDTFQKRTRRPWYRPFQTQEAEVPIYRRLVIILKLRQHPRLGPNVDTQNVYLKVFKDIPKLDVMMMLPGARVQLNVVDRGKIGMPLLGGLALAAWNVLQDLAWTIERFLSSPNAMWALAAGGVGYGYRSYYGYRQTKQRYHLTLTQSLYFQNLDSNAGVLTRLLDEAEEQECRAAVLAYFCLWRYAGEQGWTAGDLDNSMELYLDRYAELPYTCQNGQALAQLQKLRLAEPAAEGRYRVVPLERAVAALQETWNSYFATDTVPLASGGR
jgi:hypothetical protein